MPKGIRGFQKGHKDFVTLDGRKNQSNKQTGKHWKIKDTSKMKGHYPKNAFKKGHIVSDKIREKISKANKGYKHTDEAKRKIGLNGYHKGMLGKRAWNKGLKGFHAKEKHYNWQGGKSFELYGFDWTDLLKHSIRTRDCFICRICKKHGWMVHHIDYNKNNCNPDNLVTLCHSCHSKTNFHREYWIKYFKKNIKEYEIMSTIKTLNANVHIGGGSHLPILIKLLNITDGPVLELGTGLFSTPFLHWACFDKKRKLVSYENKKQFFDMWIYNDEREVGNDYSYHEVNFVENNDWDKVNVLEEYWSIAFIDHNPGPRRREEMKRLAHGADYVVVHDTDEKNDWYYKYAEYFPLFKYRWDSKIYPRTTVLSNYRLLEKL